MQFQQTSKVKPQGQQDFLGTFALSTSAAATTVSVFAKNPYASILIVVYATAWTSPPVAVSLNNDEFQWADNSAAVQYAGPVYPSITGTLKRQCLLPCFNSIGDRLNITVYSLGNLTGTSPNVDIYGQTYGPVPAVRSDGRLYPIGLNPYNGGNAAAGTATVIPAPTSPVRIILQSCAISGTVGGGGTNVTATGTINGAVTNFLQPLNASPFGIIDWGGYGFLLDAGSSLQCIQGGAGFSGLTGAFDYTV